jgi:DASH complex subunit SPC19
MYVFRFTAIHFIVLPTNSYLSRAVALNLTFISFTQDSRLTLQRYLVLPEPTVSAHKHLLSHHLAPQIDTLIAKSESNIEAQRSKIKRLEEHYSLLEQAKLPSLPNISAEGPAGGVDTSDLGEGEEGMDDQLVGVDLKDITPAQRRKIMMLKGKRTRLERERNELGM